MATVTNLISKSVVLRAADGEEVQIPPKSTVNIERKFLWRIPKDKIRVESAETDGMAT